MPEYAYRKNRPTVPVILWHGDRKARTPALLDSGADVSLFHRADATLLGLRWEEGAIRTLENPDGSLFRIREFTLEVEIAEQRFPARVQFADVASEFRLLGRADIFRRFRITFNEAENVVEFEPR